MLTLEEKIEKLKEEHERETAKAKAHDEINKALKGIVGFGYDKAFSQSDCVWVDIGTHSPYMQDEDKRRPIGLNDAIALAEVMCPEPLFFYRDGCAGFKPEALMDFEKHPVEGIDEATEKAVGKSWGVCPYILHTDGLYSNEPELRLWTVLGGHLCRVSIAVIYDHSLWHVSHDISYNRRGEIVRSETRLTNNTGHFNKDIKWGRGDNQYPNSFTMYS